ncbi:MAG: hypothetical protein WC924_02335 [Candidatus Gracilibacteria bacterium]
MDQSPAPTTEPKEIELTQEERKALTAFEEWYAEWPKTTGSLVVSEVHVYQSGSTPRIIIFKTGTGNSVGYRLSQAAENGKTRMLLSWDSAQPGADATTRADRESKNAAFVEGVLRLRDELDTAESVKPTNPEVGGWRASVQSFVTKCMGAFNLGSKH